MRSNNKLINNSIFLDEQETDIGNDEDEAT